MIRVSPLSLNQLTRDYWGQYDPAVCAQLAALAADPCYTQKFYKAPADNEEVVEAFGYRTRGLRITPGSLIYGFYLPAVANVSAPASSAPGQYTVQIVDVDLERKIFDIPISSLLVSNFKPTYQSSVTTNMGSFLNLLPAVHCVTGTGQIDVRIQETSGAVQRIQFLLGVFEVCE